MKKIKNTSRLISVVIVSVLCLTSCDDFLDIVPTGRIIPTTAQEYRELLTEAYSYIQEGRGLASFRSDEIDMTGAQELEMNSYKDIWTWNDANPSDNTISFPWERYYYMIFITNTVIENEKNIQDGKPEEINQIVGEAYMIRGYIHFLLVNLYAVPYNAHTAKTDKGIPLKLSSNTDEVLSRNSVEEVYNSVLSDISEAQKRLNIGKWDTGLNYRFNSVSAEALKSRVYLYMADWENSLKASQNVLTVRNELSDLTQTSTKLPNHFTSPESIVALEQVIRASYNTAIRIPKALLDRYKTGDMRKSRYYTAQTASIYILAKGGSADFRCSFRTGEIYLNAAEAALETGDPDSAKQYLLQLLSKRFRASNFPAIETEINAMNDADLRVEIQNQRFLELAFEGHRWFDLRRTTRPQITKTLYGTTYTLEQNDDRYTIRIPQEAINNNPGLLN